MGILELKKIWRHSHPHRCNYSQRNRPKMLRNVSYFTKWLEEKSKVWNLELWFPVCCFLFVCFLFSKILLEVDMFSEILGKNPWSKENWVIPLLVNLFFKLSPIPLLKTRICLPGLFNKSRIIKDSIQQGKGRQWVLSKHNVSLTQR